MIKRYLLKFLTVLGPALLISIIAFILFFVFVFEKHGSSLIFTDASISLPILAMSVICLVNLFGSHPVLLNGKIKKSDTLSKRIKEVLVEWLPLPLMIFVFENLQGHIHTYAKRDYAHFLAQLDAWQFGAQPTLILQKITNPVLTDILAFCYFTYFFIPLICCFFLYIQGRKNDFHVATSSIIVCFYLGFVGYLLCPATLPSYYLRQVYSVPLQGFFHQFMESAYAKANATEIWGAFPSLHIAISTLGLILSYSFTDMLGKGRKLFWYMLPVVLGLWFSTLYLRYHWTFDIYAGWFLAFLSFYLGKRIAGRWNIFQERINKII